MRHPDHIGAKGLQVPLRRCISFMLLDTDSVEFWSHHEKVAPILRTVDFSDSAAPYSLLS